MVKMTFATVGEISVTLETWAEALAASELSL